MRYLFFVFAFLTFTNLRAQAFTAGFLPDITLSYKVGENYTVINKVESRFPTYDSESKTGDIIFERIDFQGFLERKIGLFSKAAVGYQFRINNKAENEHRFIQQLTWSDYLIGLRLGHRIRSDQTVSEGMAPEFRIRYRAKVQLPLQGRKLDEGEYYFTLADEVLSVSQSSEFALDNRVVAQLGLYINDKNKFEMGLDWRMEGYTTDRTEHSLWFAFSWYKRL